MSDDANDDTIETHVFRDPHEALSHFTPEAMARALPRTIELDPEAPPMSPPPGDDDVEAPPPR